MTKFNGGCKKPGHGFKQDNTFAKERLLKKKQVDEKAQDDIEALEQQYEKDVAQEPSETLSKIMRNIDEVSNSVLAFC